MSSSNRHFTTAHAPQVAGTVDDKGWARRHPRHAATPTATANRYGAHQGGNSQMPCNAMTASAATLPNTCTTNPRPLRAGSHASRPIRISGAADWNAYSQVMAPTRSAEGSWRKLVDQ